MIELIVFIVAVVALSALTLLLLYALIELEVHKTCVALVVTIYSLITKLVVSTSVRVKRRVIMWICVIPVFNLLAKKYKRLRTIDSWRTLMTIETELARYKVCGNLANYQADVASRMEKMDRRLKLYAARNSNDGPFISLAEDLTANLKRISAIPDPVVHPTSITRDLMNIIYKLVRKGPDVPQE